MIATAFSWFYCNLFIFLERKTKTWRMPFFLPVICCPIMNGGCVCVLWCKSNWRPANHHHYRDEWERTTKSE
ncbi:hypothetical protein ACA910_020796 [Epithemia clementina (nom. ined.)]